jgi:integrase/recombinase XerD
VVRSEKPKVVNSCGVEAAPGPKYKAALSAAYSAGLRVSEVVALKVSDIDSERLLLRIEQGKGRKDRFAMLSPKLLELVRDWYRIARPPAGRCCR